MLLERVGEGPNKILHLDQITICLNPGHKLRRLAADLQNACFSWLENQRCFIRAIPVGWKVDTQPRFPRHKPGDVPPCSSQPSLT